MPDRLVLIVPKTSYNGDAFLAAARRAGAEVVVAIDRCHVLDGLWEFPPESVVIDFHDPAEAARKIVELAPDAKAVVPAGGESAALVAAMTAARLGLPHNRVEAAQAAANKLRMRELCVRGGVRQPRFLVAGVDEDPVDRVAREVGFPCVVKPLLLSGSRGVIRADDRASFARAYARVRAILRPPEMVAMDPDEVYSRRILVESFVPGVEVAFEGVLTGGALTTLALYDKPDPLDGPFFEETIYVTPSRHDPEPIAREVAAASRAMGLSHGPVHAELRLSPEGPVAIEVAARSIGGLCSRMLRFGTGHGLEDVLVRHALGQPVADVRRERPAAGAMMIPIPRAGVLRAAGGVDEARAVPGVDDVVISAPIESELVPLPEGSSYLGFIFAHGDTPEAVTQALREAHARLRFTIASTLPVS